MATQQFNVSQSSGCALSNANLTLTANGADWGLAYCLNFFSTGKYYFEWLCGLSGLSYLSLGIANSTPGGTPSQVGGDPGNAVGIYWPAGDPAQEYYNNAPLGGNPGGTWNANNTVVGCAVDFGAQLIWWKDTLGVWYGNGATAGDPVAGTNGRLFSAIPGPWTVGAALFTGQAGTMRFASGSWTTGPAPTGYGAFDAVVGGAGGGLLLFGGSVMCGWTPPSLPFLGAAAAWKAGQAIRRNATLSRRSLIGKR